MNASKTRGRLKLAFKSVAKAVGRHYADRVAEAAAALPAVIPEAQEIHSQGTLRPEVAEKLRRGPEQTRTVGPIVELLLESSEAGHSSRFNSEDANGTSPSALEATKREKGRSFGGFPADITVFDDPRHFGDYGHVVLLFEGKTPHEEKGVAQLETMMSLEPRAPRGVWAKAGEIVQTPPRTGARVPPSDR